MGRKFERAGGALRIREVAVSYVAPPSATTIVTDPAFAAEIFARHFDTLHQPQEILMAMYLDSRSRFIAVESLYRGTLNSALVGTRELMRSALLLNAAGVIVAHVHPSGDPEPSAEDLAFTRKIADAGRQLSIELRDHLVLGVGNDGSPRYVSFKQRALI